MLQSGSREEQGIQLAESLYDDISKVPGFHGEVVIDDRYEKTIGHRRKDANILGYPYVIVVGKKVSYRQRCAFFLFWVLWFHRMRGKEP